LKLQLDVPRHGADQEVSLSPPSTRRARTTNAKGLSSIRSNKSSMNSIQEPCSRFQALAIPDGQQISVDQDGGNQGRFFGLKGPELALDLDLSGRILPEPVDRKESGPACSLKKVAVAGLRSPVRRSPAGSPPRRRLYGFNLCALCPIQLLGGISSKQELGPKRARMGFDPLGKEMFPLEHMTRPLHLTQEAEI
jgi:hypothetical protein